MLVFVKIAMKKKRPHKNEKRTVKTEGVHQPSKKRQVFLSYARENSDWMQAIYEHLDNLQDYEIDTWSDIEKISPGAVIDEEISDGIGQSNVALFLISKHFVQSKYIVDKESRWVENARKKGLKIMYVPIYDVGDDEAKHAVRQFLEKRHYDQQLSGIPLDTPLRPNYDKKRNKGDVIHVVSNIRRIIDENFSKLERHIDSKYTILEEVGVGESARVYRARRESVAHEFAIKVLKNSADIKWFRASFEDASSVSEINNIIPMFDHSFRKSLSYCVLKFIEGTTLSEYISNNRPISIEFVAKVIEKLGRALIHVRKEPAFKNVYLKIRPENVLIELQSREPYLSLAIRPNNQRGYAYLKTLQDRMRESEELNCEEALAYVIPEFAIPQEAEPDPQKFDQYLLGLMGYQMLTGRVPNRLDGIEGFPNDVENIADLDESKFKSLDCCVEERKQKFHLIMPVIERMLCVDANQRYENLSTAIDAVENPELYSLKLVKESFQRCISTDGKGEQFFMDFYRAFLKRSPSSKDAFLRHRFAVERRTQGVGSKWASQMSVLKHAILLLINFFENYSRGDTAEPNILTFYRKKHLTKKLSPSIEQYTDFRKALLDTVEQHDAEWIGIGSGKYWRELWTAVLTPGISYMFGKK